MIFFALPVEVSLHHFPLLLFGDRSWKVVFITSSSLRGRSVWWSLFDMFYQGTDHLYKLYKYFTKLHIPLFTYDWMVPGTGPPPWPNFTVHRLFIWTLSSSNGIYLMLILNWMLTLNIFTWIILDWSLSIFSLRMHKHQYSEKYKCYIFSIYLNNNFNSFRKFFYS